MALVKKYWQTLRTFAVVNWITLEGTAKVGLMIVNPYLVKMEERVPMACSAISVTAQMDLQEKTVKPKVMSVLLALVFMVTVRKLLLHITVFVNQDTLESTVNQTSMTVTAGHAKMELLVLTW
jgi:hypothetical protein